MILVVEIYHDHHHKRETQCEVKHIYGGGASRREATRESSQCLCLSYFDFLSSTLSFSLSLSLSLLSFLTQKERMNMCSLIYLSVLLVLILPLPSSLSTNSEGNALHAFRTRLSDPNNVLQSWDPTLVNSCTWFHVTCDSNNHVIRL